MVLVFADGRYTERINTGCLLMGQSVFMIEVSKEVKGEHPCPRHLCRRSLKVSYWVTHIQRMLCNGFALPRKENEMAKSNKADMSCARVKKYTASDVSKAERHNERKNETYENMNVIEERIPYNVHFKKPFAPTYMEQLKQMETDGMVSLRGLRKDATLFNEIVIDVNTMYFERNGGYEYAKQFYEEAFHFIEEKFGADNVISAVMHADEINVAATEELGKEVYHYHLHAMVLPVVEKEILWSKRCKDEKLRGTVKEVVHQISHSKKWKSDIPLTDEKGKPLLRKNGKPMFRASYSILQDELFNYIYDGARVQRFSAWRIRKYRRTSDFPAISNQTGQGTIREVAEAYSA